MIDAQTENGAITLTSSDQGTVIVQALIEVRAPDNKDGEEFTRKVQVFVEQEGSKIRIHKQHPKPPKDINVSVGYDIQSPRDVNADLRTSNGKIAISEVDGTVDAATSNGKIDLHGGSGHVNLRTSNGAIVASLDTLREKGVFDTSNGSIDVKIHKGIGGTEVCIDMARGPV